MRSSELDVEQLFDNSNKLPLLDLQIFTNLNQADNFVDNFLTCSCSRCRALDLSSTFFHRSQDSLEKLNSWCSESSLFDSNVFTNFINNSRFDLSSFIGIYSTFIFFNLQELFKNFPLDELESNYCQLQLDVCYLRTFLSRISPNKFKIFINRAADMVFVTLSKILKNSENSVHYATYEEIVEACETFQKNLKQI
ncbi:hypothetical protein GEMRC1_001416 [Eukaryota sp. GEM-RC1]